MSTTRYGKTAEKKRKKDGSLRARAAQVCLVAASNNDVQSPCRKTQGEKRDLPEGNPRRKLRRRPKKGEGYYLSAKDSPYGPRKNFHPKDTTTWGGKGREENSRQGIAREHSFTSEEKGLFAYWVHGFAMKSQGEKKKISSSASRRWNEASRSKKSGKQSITKSTMTDGKATEKFYLLERHVLRKYQEEKSSPEGGRDQDSAS